MRILLLAAVLTAGAAPVRALTTLGGDFTTGQGYRGFDVKGSLNLDSKAEWVGNAAYSHAQSNVGQDTLSNQIVLGITNYSDDDWTFRGSLTGWKDQDSGVRYIGPSGGFTYIVYDGAGTDPEDEVVDILYDNDVFFYETGVSESSATIKTVKVGRKSTPIVAPAYSGRLNLVQFHPNLEIDKPLFAGSVVPGLSYGHYFYSKDPTIIENAVGSPRYAAASDSLNSMVGGFFWNSGQALISFYLPRHVVLRGALGLEQQASDETWSTTQSLTAIARFHETVKVTTGWSRSIQDGVPQDLFSIGALWIF